MSKILKKTVRGFLALSLLAVVSVSTASAELKQDNEGVYLISNASELQEFRDLVNNGKIASMDAKLTSDIDLKEELWRPIGTDDNNAYKKATFDGQGHTVFGLNVTADSVVSKDRVNGGLFGFVDDSVIQDLSVKGKISLDYVDGEKINVYGGGIVGYLYSTSKVLKCSFSGTVFVSGGGNLNVAGGIAGRGYDCHISDCFVETDNIRALGGSGGAEAGGIIGNFDGFGDSAYIIKSSLVNVTGEIAASDAGGIAGKSILPVVDSLVIGKGSVSALGNSPAGGIVGRYSNMAIANVALIKGCAFQSGLVVDDRVLGVEDGVAAPGSIKIENSGVVSSELASKMVKFISLPAEVTMLKGQRYEVKVQTKPSDVFDGSAGEMKISCEGEENEKIATVEYSGGNSFAINALEEGVSSVIVKSLVYGVDFSGAEPVISKDITTFLLARKCRINVTASKDSGGSSGGCSAGLGTFALLALIPIALRGKKR